MRPQGPNPSPQHQMGVSPQHQMGGSPQRQPPGRQQHPRDRTGALMRPQQHTGNIPFLLLLSQNGCGWLEWQLCQIVISVLDGAHLLHGTC